MCWGGGVAGYHFRLCPLSRYLVFGQLIGGAVYPSIAPSQVEWPFSGGYVALGRRVIAFVRDVNSCLVACIESVSVRYLYVHVSISIWGR